MTSWNDREEDALQGLPLRAQVVYLRGIRRHMDYATGLAGIERRISYKQLSEVAEVYPDIGSNKSKEVPTKDAARAAVDQLERVGLIEKIKTGHERQLVFKCLLASRDESVRRRNTTGNTTRNPTHPYNYTYTLPIPINNYIYITKFRARSRDHARNRAGG